MRAPGSVITAVLQQGTQVADSLRTDSIAVESPLPSPALHVVRFLFNTVPQWVQIGGVFLAAAVAIVLAILTWRNRVALHNWFGAKSRAWKMGFAAIALVMLGGVAFAGTWSWNYMMHTNEFCSGCHIMAEPFQRFGTSEHAKLGCHDCHRQSIFASMKELYVQVTERPDKIPEHRGVPNAICSECHIQRDPDSTWKRVSATAGHQVHLNPRSPVMSKIECITCHGQEVHRFKPVGETCAQSGCHDDVKVELGKMAQQTDLHCVVCHEFTVAATEGNPIDSSRAALTPGDQQCLGCHAMRERLGQFAPEDEPHGAKCGSCHNPHVQTTPEGAFQSCATSGCHTRSDTLTSMHRNLGRHRLQTCGACHGAHTWKANAVDCRSCHTGITDPAVRTRPPDHPAIGSSGSGTGGGAWPTGGAGDYLAPAPHARPPLVLTPASFTTTQRQAVLASSPAPAGRARQRGHTAAAALTVGGSRAPPQGRDSARFDHARHDALSCTTCHSTRAGHGDLRVSVARDCQGCHHENQRYARDCARCHTAAELGGAKQLPTVFALTVFPRPTTRSLPFAHTRHASLECGTCHAAGKQKKVARDCASCHANHHTAEATCASCHPPARTTHKREVHATGCATSGCHDRETGAAVTPVRATCLACHAEQRDHKPERECAPCHLSAWTGTGGTRP
jgi:nitrate/TMAO reductase-like tetraheme cytochrome c subunit